MICRIDDFQEPACDVAATVTVDNIPLCAAHAAPFRSESDKHRAMNEQARRLWPGRDRVRHVWTIEEIL